MLSQWKHVCAALEICIDLVRLSEGLLIYRQWSGNSHRIKTLKLKSQNESRPWCESGWWMFLVPEAKTNEPVPNRRHRVSHCRTFTVQITKNDKWESVRRRAPAQGRFIKPVSTEEEDLLKNHKKQKIYEKPFLCKKKLHKNSASNIPSLPEAL